MLEDLQHRNLRTKHLANGRQETSCRELVGRAGAVLYVDASDEASSALYVSRHSGSMAGYPREEWLEDPDLWTKIVHPEDREHVVAEHLRARREGVPFEAEYRLVARDGSVVWVRDEAVPVAGAEVGGGAGRRAGVLLDITDGKRYERALRKSEERHRLVAKATGEAIWDNDLLTGEQTWDGATEALFGYPPHAGGTGAWWEERIHPEDRGRVLAGLESVLALGGGEAWAEEYRFRRADGSYAHVADRGHVVRDGQDRPVRMVGAMADVTERRRWEEEIRAGEERFRTTFEAVAVGMAHLAPDGRWLRVNEKLCEIVGYAREELLGSTFQDVTHPEDLEKALERVGWMLAGEVEEYSMEKRCLRKDRSWAWVNTTVSVVRKPTGEADYFVSVVEDITERKLRQLAFDSLTSREREVAGLMTRDCSNAEMAERLSLSIPTVKTHVRHVLVKLGVKDRRELLRSYRSGTSRPF